MKYMETFIDQEAPFKRKKPSRRTINTWLWAWLLIAPTILGLLLLNIIPTFQTLYQSFFKSGDFGKGNIFCGIDNYATLIADSQVWGAVLNTLLYAVIVVPVTVIVAMLFALLLNLKIKGTSVYRTIYFIPMIAAPAAVTMIWRWLYNDQFGLINVFLNKIGFASVDWVNDPNIALFSICVIGIWSAIGYDMVLLLAGLQEIPRDYYEASGIDGASPARQFFSITLPLISPTMYFVVLTSLITALQVFDVIYMMVDVQSPAYNNTVSLVYLFYNNSFKYSNKGYGSAIVMLLLVIIMIFTLIQSRLQKKWVNYM